MPSTLSDVRADIDRRLLHAAGDRHSPMHTPVVGTADASVRVMVLRAWDADGRVLRFHTDARAPKTDAIETGEVVGVLFYDPEAKIQIRAYGTGRVERIGPLADAAWSKASNYARRCYLTEAGPGTQLDSPGSGLPPEVEGEKPTDAQIRPARENFAVLLVDVAKLDWLYLDHEGHRRAIFEGGQGRWVVP